MMFSDFSVLVLFAMMTAFFLLLATLNELVWRTQSTDFWVSFKVFGILPLTIIFALFQLPIITKDSNHKK